MHEIIMTRREYRAIKENADRRALYAKYLKPIKAVTAVSLAAAIVAGGSASAMAATGPTLGPAPTVTQIAAAQASAPSETITGVSETADGLNIDVSMSDASTVLSVNTIADDSAGNFKIQVLASGITAGNWTDAVGQSFTSPFGADTATVTVTAVNGNMVDLDVSLTTAPSITPNFTASGSSTGPAPVAPKTNPVAVEDSVVLDTTKQSSITVDVLANDTPSPGYVIDPSTLMLTNPITGGPTTSQKGNATLTVVNGKVDVTAVSNWSGFTQANYTAKEQWAGAGSEPAGYQAATITGQLKVQIIGAEPVQTSPTDCTVPVAPSGGSGFSVVPMAISGSTGLNCNLVAGADAVSIAADASEGTVKVGSNDTTTNSSYSINPQSIQFRAADGTFAQNVTYPGQFSLSYDSTTGITTVKRLGTYSGTPQVLYRVSESKLDASGNNLIGGESSALLSMDFAAVTTPETPVTVPVVPETPVTVPETPVTVSVVPVVPTPVTATSTRPFVNIGNTSAAPASKAASVTPQGSDNNTGISLAAVVGLIALGTAGAFTVKARHRKVQTSDVSA